MGTKREKNRRNKVPKIIFIIGILSIVTYVYYQQEYISVGAMLSQSEGATLEFVSDIIEVDISKNQEFIVNQDQLIWITEDGVKALSLDGEEIWADTHTLKNIAVVQQMPYFAISEKGGQTISIFGINGKKTDIKFTNPVIYFSMNKQGDIVVVESIKDGHVISAYDEKGNSLGVKRVTYIEDGGYPTSAEISPDGKMIIISYLNTNEAQILSNIIAMAIDNDGTTNIDNILYGETYKNTIISELEFISEDIWVAVGDNSMSFNKVDGTEIKKMSDVYYNYAPALNRLDNWQGINYTVISSAQPIMSTVHPVEKLTIYTQTGEEVEEFILEDATTYMYGDGKTTVVGSDRKFTAYNRSGGKRWGYTATKDIQKMIPLHSQKQVIMISKGKVELMQVVK